eukprot:6197336-Pleurochrysis_carterae.AAC.1
MRLRARAYLPCSGPCMIERLKLRPLDQRQSWGLPRLPGKESPSLESCLQNFRFSSSVTYCSVRH